MKTIKIRTFEKVMVPVMRNGKPTKKTKAEWRPILVDIEMDCIEHEGYLIYFNPNENISCAYKENGEALTGEFKYGSYGTALHKEVLRIKNNKLVTSSLGYSGSTTKGWGGRLVKINW